MLTGGFKTVDGFQKASKIVLGTNAYGSVIDEKRSFEIFDRYYELGGFTFDTARSYNVEFKNGASKSERTVGRWIRKNNLRDKITLVTKGCYPELRDMHYSRLSPDCMEYDINTSLAVLDLDYVDMWFLHRDDERIPVKEIVDAADEIVKSGLVRAIGASNWTAKRIAEANEYARAAGKTEFTASEIQWNMAEFTKKMHRDDTMAAMYDVDYEWYNRSRMPVFAYSAQAVGFFSKYPQVGAEGLKPFTKVFLSDANIKRCEAAAEVCAELGCTPSQLCIAYIANNDVDGYAVISSSSIAQLEDSMKAAELIVDKEIIKRIDSIRTEE